MTAKIKIIGKPKAVKATILELLANIQYEKLGVKVVMDRPDYKKVYGN